MIKSMVSNFMNNNEFIITIIFHSILASITLLLISFREKLSSYFQIIDYPNSNHLKIHNLPIPRFGGIILFFYTFIKL